MADTIRLTTQDSDTVTLTINGTTYYTQAQPDALISQEVTTPYTDIVFDEPLVGEWMFGGQPFCYNDLGIIMFTISNITAAGFRVHPVETATFNASIWRV
jgi:hypothetical protein